MYLPGDKAGLIISSSSASLGTKARDERLGGGPPPHWGVGGLGGGERPVMSPREKVATTSDEPQGPSANLIRQLPGRVADVEK